MYWLIRTRGGGLTICAMVLILFTGWIGAVVWSSRIMSSNEPECHCIKAVCQ